MNGFNPTATQNFIRMTAANWAANVATLVSSNEPLVPNTLYMVWDDTALPAGGVPSFGTAATCGVSLYQTDETGLKYWVASLSQSQLVTLIQATGGASAVWGNITGTLSNQTDLQSALNAKMTIVGTPINNAVLIDNGSGQAADSGVLISAVSTAITQAGNAIPKVGGATVGHVAVWSAGGVLSDGGALPSGTVTSVDASGGTTGLTFTGGPITNTGTLTLGGTLAVANGGTGSTTASEARTALGALGTTLASANIFVGNGSAVATAVSMSGDATLSNTGVITIANGAITTAKMANLAASTILGNPTGSSASPSEITLGTNLSFSGNVLNATGGGGSSVDFCIINIGGPSTSSSGDVPVTFTGSVGTYYQTSGFDGSFTIGGGDPNSPSSTGNLLFVPNSSSNYMIELVCQLVPSGSGELGLRIFGANAHGQSNGTGQMSISAGGWLPGSISQIPLQTTSDTNVSSVIYPSSFIRITKLV